MHYIEFIHYHQEGQSVKRNKMSELTLCNACRLLYVRVLKEGQSVKRNKMSELTLCNACRLLYVVKQ